MVAFVSISNGVSAQEYNRERLRGNIRTINQGGLVPIDSAAILRTKAEAAARRDSLYYNFIDSIGRAEYKLYNETAIEVRDSLRKVIAQRVKRDSAIVMHGDSIAPDGRRIRLNKRGEERKPFISDSMGLSKVCWLSLPLPGFGQIYNKQYWKLPILYGTVGASLGLCLWSNSKYQPLKKQFNSITDENLFRTPELNALQSQMIKYNTMRQVFMISTIASYLYFIGDATIKYSTNEVSQVSKATTLALICPGAGQVYNKSYWRVPIVIGGFATTIYCIDWNNRGYQRFKKAYRLRYDAEQNPSLYPNGSPDEFGGRYASSFLKNLRNSYRRNRDLCIILTAGIYLLQIMDAHVDAHLRDYDISDDLSVDINPTIDYAYHPGAGNIATMGMNFSFKF